MLANAIQLKQVLLNLIVNGMGLTISRTIVETHGGRIGGEQEEPFGAVFRLRLSLP